MLPFVVRYRPWLSGVSGKYFASCEGGTVQTSNIAGRHLAPVHRSRLGRHPAGHRSRLVVRSRPEEGPKMHRHLGRRHILLSMLVRTVHCLN
jgi:hypothetical protein